MQKVYFKNPFFEINEEACIYRNGERNFPIETISRVEKEVIKPSNKLKAIIYFIGACFILSEVNVTKAPIPDWIAYVISAIIFGASLYHFFIEKTNVIIFFKNGRTFTAFFGTKGTASAFFVAIKDVVRRHEYNNKKQADN